MTTPSKLTHRPVAASCVLALSLTGAIAGFGVTAANATVVHTPQSIECSKEADAKGLHGKAREKFRSECKHNAAQSAKASQTMPTPKPAPVKAPY